MKIASTYNPVRYKNYSGIKNTVYRYSVNLKDNLSFAAKIKKSISPAEYRKRLRESGLDSNTCTTEQIFDCLGIYYEKDEDGKLTINAYKQPSIYLKFWDFGIREDDILKDVVEIKGDAIFSGSKAKSLGSVKYIGGNAYFQNSKFEDTNDLEYIGKDAYFQNSRMKKILKVKDIEGNAYFQNSKVEDFGDLEYVGKDIWLDSSFNNFGKIKYVGGTVHIV